MPDVIVVGAGPAGMAAAAASSRRGARVVLVDGAPRLGGQYFRQPLAEPANNGDQPVPTAGPRLPARFQPPDSQPGCRAPARLRGLVRVEGSIGLHPPSHRRRARCAPFACARNGPRSFRADAPISRMGAPGRRYRGCRASSAQVSACPHRPAGRGGRYRALPAYRWRPLWPKQGPVYSWSRQRGPLSAPGHADSPAAPPQVEGGGRIWPGAGPAPGAGAHRLGCCPLRGRRLCRASGPCPFGAELGTAA